MGEKIRIEETVFNTSQNVLIIGCGGTGKSFLLKNLVDKACTLEKKCEATAPTGVAAVNINGSTLHRFFGVGLCKGKIDYIINYAKRNYEAVRRIQTTNILVIDEISMVGEKLFKKLDLVARHFRKCDEPFGGMQLVVSGDFLQLPPINEKWVFDSKQWKALKFKPFFMVEPYRFTDTSFYQMLMRAREGFLNRQDICKIKSRVKAYNEYKEHEDKHEIKPTILSSLRAEVDTINQSEMVKLPGEPHDYQSTDNCISISNNIKLSSYQSQLDYLAPKVLSLKVGAQIMITWNLNVDKGLCNGTRGVIKELDFNTITILTCKGEQVTIERNTFLLKDKHAKVTRCQFPIMLAFAVTIHKAQGSTLDFCVVDLGPDVFAAGQGYVALSRARSWESLLVSSFTRSSIKADKHALAFVTELEEQCADFDES